MLNRIVSWKGLPIVVLLLTAFASAKADLIPTYRYFYSCSSGVVDCVNFQLNHNYYGDFGMNGVTPVNHPSLPFTLTVAISNQRGEVLGYAGGSGGGESLAYGFNGVVMCVPGACRDNGDSPIALNDNGLFLFRSSLGEFCEYIGSGFNEVAHLGQTPSGETPCGYSDAVDLRNFQFGDIKRIFPLGINDDDQILVTIQLQSTEGRSIQGVLSPNPVPEPTTVVLFGTILVGIVWRIRKRRVFRLTLDGYDANRLGRGQK